MTTAQITRTDPRGPFRTITNVERTANAALVRFAECDHESRRNQIYTYKVGDKARCFACRGTA